MTNKRILITGGTGGIGRALSSAFADNGSLVTVTAISQREVDEFDAKGCKVEARLLDVTDGEQVDQVVGQIERLDVLINCAGIICRDDREFEQECFQRVVDVNLNATMHMCTACKPLLADTRGCVLNVASMLSFIGSGYVPAYSASKGGVVQLTKSLAIAWAADGIRVNAIAPGWIETEFTKSLRDDPSRSRAIVDRTPLGRWGKPADLSGAALFLCSSAAAFITGVVLSVDGGYSVT